MVLHKSTGCIIILGKHPSSNAGWDDSPMFLGKPIVQQLQMQAANNSTLQPCNHICNNWCWQLMVGLPALGRLKVRWDILLKQWNESLRQTTTWDQWKRSKHCVRVILMNLKWAKIISQHLWQPCIVREVGMLTKPVANGKSDHAPPARDK